MRIDDVNGLETEFKRVWAKFKIIGNSSTGIQGVPGAQGADGAPGTDANNNMDCGNASSVYGGNTIYDCGGA